MSKIGDNIATARELGTSAQCAKRVGKVVLATYPPTPQTDHLSRLSRVSSTSCIRMSRVDASRGCSRQLHDETRAQPIDSRFVRLRVDSVLHQVLNIFYLCFFLLVHQDVMYRLDIFCFPSLVGGAAVAEQLACSPPTKAIRAQSPARSLRIFACGNRARRCRWSAGLLGNLPLPPPLHSGAAPYLPQSPTSVLKTSRAVKISSVSRILETVGHSTVTTVQHGCHHTQYGHQRNPDGTKEQENLAALLHAQRSGIYLQLHKDRGGVVVRLLASHLGEPGSIPVGVAPGFSHLGVVQDDAAGLRVFSAISRFPRSCIPPLHHPHLASLSSALISTSGFLRVLSYWEDEMRMLVFDHDDCGVATYIIVDFHDFPEKALACVISMRPLFSLPEMTIVRVGMDSAVPSVLSAVPLVLSAVPAVLNAVPAVLSVVPVVLSAVLCAVPAVLSAVLSVVPLVINAVPAMLNSAPAVLNAVPSVLSAYGAKGCLFINSAIDFFGWDTCGSSIDIEFFRHDIGCTIDFFGLRCCYCGKIFAYSHNARRHETNCVQNVEHATFKCEKCKSQCVWRNENLKRHLETCTGLPSLPAKRYLSTLLRICTEVVNDATSTVKSSKQKTLAVNAIGSSLLSSRLPCSYCDKTFANANKARRHESNACVKEYHLLRISVSLVPHNSGVGWPTCSRRLAGSRPGASDVADAQLDCRTGNSSAIRADSPVPRIRKHFFPTQHLLLTSLLMHADEVSLAGRCRRVCLAGLS
ncbi:hypothetical protein PR048_010151, partial [Dryococelus australis]